MISTPAEPVFWRRAVKAQVHPETQTITSRIGSSAAIARVEREGAEPLLAGVLEVTCPGDRSARAQSSRSGASGESWNG